MVPHVTACTPGLCKGRVSSLLLWRAPKADVVVHCRFYTDYFKTDYFKTILYTAHIMTKQHSVDAENGATKNGQQDVEAVTGESAHVVFDDWCAEVGLNNKSVTLLKKECVSTVHVLSLLTGEDIVSLGLPLGQRKLMQEAIDTSFKSDRKDVVQPPLTSPPPEDVQVVHTVADVHTAPLATRGGERPARGNPNEGGGVQASVTT